MRAWIIGLIVLGLVFPCLAQEEEKKEKEEAVTLEEVVVTATRTEKSVETAPGSVTVVGQEEIKKRNIQTVDQALNAIPGVMNRRATGLLDPIATITMRGLPGSQRTLMMLDGFTLNDPYSGGQRDLLGIAPEDVERIEVIRGPFSSLYGGYAMGGVVNVITKMPEERKISFKPGYGSDISREEGLENLRRVYFSYGDKFFDKLSTYISYGYRATDGYTTDYNVTSKTPPEGITGGSPTTSSTGASRYLIGDKGDREWWDDSLSVKGKYEFTDVTNLSLSFTKTRNEYKYDDVQTYLYDSDGQEVWSYGTVTEKSFLAGEYGREGINSSATLETKISSLQVKLTAGILDWDKSWNTVAGSDATSSGGSGTISDCPLTAYNSDLQFTLPLFERHILTFGGTGRQSEVENTTKALTDWRNKDSTTNLTYQAEGKSKGFSVFVQDEIMILDNLTVYIGVREDWWETYDGYANDVGEEGYPQSFDSRSASYFSPKASVVYSPLEKTTLRASIGKAFRPPTVYELYRTYTGSYGTVYASNPDLDPETTTSWDLGVEQKLWKGAKVGITYFDNLIEDLIYSTSPYSGYYEKQNAGEARSKGFEIEVEQKFDKWLTLFANYTYTDAEITENDAAPETVGKQLTDVPENMYNLGAYVQWGRFSASAIGRYISKRYSSDENLDTVDNVFGSYDPFFVTDVKVSYKLSDMLTLSLSVDNLFDEQYYNYRKQPGTSWYFELGMDI